MLTSDAMGAYGWRIPLLIGCGIIPVILWLRRSLQETTAFSKMPDHPRRVSAVLGTMAENWVLVLTGMLLVVFTTTSFYLITAYTPTFGRQALHLEPSMVFVVTCGAGISNFLWLPLSRGLSARIRRSPLPYVIPCLARVTSDPAMTRPRTS